jgi:DNA-binding response OmpR family regulator
MKKVLIADDEPNIVISLEFLMKQNGYEVRVARDGEEALQQTAAFEPDLILLDVMLPKMSGLEVCKSLRAEGWAGPILMLTARGQEIDKVVGLELGADDYVTKPFSLRELSARIRAIFRRAEQLAATQGLPPLVDLGRVQVDLAGHRVLRDGIVVPLKPKAFELFAFLVRNQGQVFTRDQLLERVWGYDYAGETRTVDVHVHWLRAELEEDPSSPVLIQTVRGVGYVVRRPGA